MILRIKLKQDSYGIYEPTGMFHINRFIDYADIKNVLLLANKYIASHNVVDYIIRNNEIQFYVKKTDDLFSIYPTKEFKFSFYKVEDVVCKASNKKRVEIFVKRGGRDACVAKAVVFAAGLYFGKESYSDIGRQYGFDHATVMNLRRKTLPSALYSRDEYAENIVNAVANMYQDDGFVDFCKEFGCTKAVVKKPKVDANKIRNANVWGYRGVYASDNSRRWYGRVRFRDKQIYLGCFESPHEAARAYNNYIIEHRLDRELNMVSK